MNSQSRCDVVDCIMNSVNINKTSTHACQQNNIESENMNENADKKFYISKI